MDNLTPEQMVRIELAMNAVDREWRFYDLVLALGNEHKPIASQVVFDFFMRLRIQLEEAERHKEDLTDILRAFSHIREDLRHWFFLMN